VSQVLRFGICTDQNLPWRMLAERWKLYEELGFDSVWDCETGVDGPALVEPFNAEALALPPEERAAAVAASLESVWP
jgi:hypothetical protein